MTRLRTAAATFSTLAAALTLVTTLLAARPAQAVVLNERISLTVRSPSNPPSPNAFFGNLQLTIVQDTGTNWTGAWFMHDQGYIKAVTFNTDEGSQWAVVRHGELISAAMLAPEAPSKVLRYSPYNSKLPLKDQGGVKVGNDFYLAGLTRTTYGAYTVFGWVHIRRDFWGRYKIVDSAVAYDEPGILAGTRLAAVPAP